LRWLNSARLFLALAELSQQHFLALAELSPAVFGAG